MTNDVANKSSSGFCTVVGVERRRRVPGRGITVKVS
jgi:hypothetical protein